MASRDPSSSLNPDPQRSQLRDLLASWGLEVPLGNRIGSWVLLLLVGSGVALSTIAYYVLREKEEAATDASFHRRAERQRLVVTESLQQHVQSLRALESLFRFSKDVDLGEFRGSAADLRRRYSGVHAFEWAPRVPADQRSAFERNAREVTDPAFQIRDRLPSDGFIPAGERPEYYPILYIEPREGNEMVLGYDIAVGPNRGVFEKARDAGVIIGTEPFALAQEMEEGVLGWVLICPVFPEGADTTSPDARRAHVLGYLQGVFRLPDVFEAAWRPLRRLGLETMLLDLTPGAPHRLLYSVDLSPAAGGAPEVGEAEMRVGRYVEHRLEIAGRQWALLTRPDPIWLEEQHSHYPEVLSLAGIIITGLLGGYLHVARTSARAVSRLVAQRTSELAASQDSLQLALQTAKMGAWEWRIADDQLRWSSSLEELHGLPSGSFSGGYERWLERVSPLDRERVRTEMVAARETRADLHSEFRIVRPDGTLRWLAASARAFTPSGGDEPLQMTGVARDITEQKAAEEEIHRRLASESEARVQAENSERIAEEASLLLDTIFRTAPVGLAFLDRELRFAKVNESLAAINGVPMKEHIGRTVQEVNPKVASQAAEHHRTVLATGEPVVNFMLEGARRLKSGKEEDGCWLASYYPIQKAQGPVLGIGIVIVDITDLKKAEENSQRLATAVEQSRELVLILSPKGEVQYANQAFYRLTGLASDAVLGEHADRLPRALLGGNPFGAIAACINEESAWSEQVNVTGSDRRQVAIDMTISPLRNEQGSLTNYVALGRDVSREVVLQERLRTAQKMEAIGLLAGGIAHDFNNLLQVIEGYTALCLDLPCSDEDLRLNLQQVREAGARAGQLTKQLLLFSRRQPLARVEIDLAELTANILKMIRRLIGPQIEVVFEAPPELRAVQADRGQLEQVLLNLCVNARDAMPDGGRLLIQVDEVELSAAEAREFPDLQPGRYVRLRVEDNGAGISAEMQKRIFEPFFTTKPGGHGTGLGLSVVYGIVQQHEGVISVKSAHGKGTTFDVYLPALARKAAPQRERGTQALVRGSETVLLVEDEEPVRQLTSIVLRQAGYEVITANDGQDACEIFEERKDDFDLVVMDVMMPRMGGVEAWKKIRKMRPVPVLFCSGYTGAPGDLPAGAPLLTKPFTSEMLLTQVRTVLEQEAAAHETVPLPATHSTAH